MSSQEPTHQEKIAGTGWELRTIVAYAFYNMIFIMNYLEQFQNACYWADL